MKKNFIYLLLTFALLLLLILVYSCADPSISKDESQTGSTPVLNNEQTISDIQVTNYFTKTVGAPIDVVKAKRWIQNYTNTNGQRFEYTIPADVLKNILSNSRCTGISLRYGLDEYNKLHIIAIGIDNSGVEIKAEKVSTANGSISWDESRKYTDNYWGTVRSHFFGSNTFDELLRKGDCKLVKVTAALDDNNQPQLLLTNGSTLDTTFFFDESSPCPPYCATRN